MSGELRQPVGGWTRRLLLLLIGCGCLALLDEVQVRTTRQLGHVAFGMPLTWVTQDLGVDPPLPYRAGFVSPWENPTSIDWSSLVLDVVLVALVLACLWHAVLAVGSRRPAE